MDKLDYVALAVVAAILIVWGLIMIDAAEGNMRTKLESESVKAGHAEYYIDKDFNKQWRWKGK